MSFSPNDDFWLNVVRGLNATYTENHKFGTNELVGTTFVPIARGSVYATPTTPTALEIVSSSGLDNGIALSAGAHTVTLEGLDSTWNKITQTVTLNGTTPVVVPISMLRAYRMLVSTSGIYADQTAGSNVGLITLRVSGAGATWLQIYDVGFGRGQSQCGAYTIESGRTGVVILHYISVDAARSANVIFFQRPLADDITTPYTGIMKSQFEFVGISGFALLVDQASPLGPFIGPCDLGYIGKMASGTGGISVDFEIVEYDTV